jgi:rubrerythrin
MKHLSHDTSVPGASRGKQLDRIEPKSEEECMEREAYQNIIGFAIECELEAEAFYESIADRLSNSTLKELFIQFAKEEKGHQAILKEIYNKPDNYKIFDGSRDYKVSETMDFPMLSDTMTPADAFAIAMKSEEMAVARYRILSDGCGDADQKKIFDNLAAMEAEHKHKMEQAFVNVAYPEVW